jgi:HSP90 family molecular chaperone
MFPKLWEEFGKNLRLGMIEDGTNRARLTKLLRYKTSKSEDKLIGLQEYVDRMSATQKSIFFIAAESLEKIKQMPVLEDALARDIEVIYMTDAIDEYVTGHVTDFAGKKLVNLAKDGVAFESTDRDKKIEKQREIKFEALTKWFKDLLGSRVTKVAISKRRVSEPLVLVSTQHGQSQNARRIMKSQTLGERSTENDELKAVLEVNHRHPLIDEIFKRIKVDPKDKVAEDTALVLYDTAALQTGFEVADSLALARRVNRLLRQSNDIALDAPLVEEDLSEYDLSDDVAEGDEKAEEAAAGEEKKEEL